MNTKKKSKFNPMFNNYFIQKKTSFLLFFVSLFLLNPLFSQSKKPDTQSLKLKNGLNATLYQKFDPKMVNVFFAVNLGSKNETKATAGYVHLLEHLLLFGSTKEHSSSELQKQMRYLGIEYNAFTNQDLVTFVLTTLPENLREALEFLKSKLFFLKFTQSELEREKTIILDEIKMIEDNPGRIGFSLVLKKLFEDHPYGRAIYGDSDLIKNASPDQILKFYNTYFLPSNSSIALTGSFDLENTQALVKEVFSSLPSSPKPVQTIKPSPPFSKKNNSSEIKMDLKQGHLFMGFSAPAKYDRDSLAFNLLVQIIGKGNNPLLNRTLRSTNRFNVRVSTQYISLIYGGTLIIHIQGEPKFLKAAGQATLKFLNKTNKIGFSKKDYPLNIRFKQSDLIFNLKSRMDIRNNRAIEKGSIIANFLGTRSIFKDIQKPEGSYPERLNQINSRDLKKMASKYLIGKKHFILTIIPEGKK